ncbi:TraB/GumN family protein [Marinicrinis sediminis]|uniref:TraB/GumN family protein n=1 Tax=Marinicrinis sediminis TaxID=1652465 RepID=A0ABW5R5K8_9BACL
MNGTYMKQHAGRKAIMLLFVACMMSILFLTAGCSSNEEAGSSANQPDNSTEQNAEVPTEESDEPSVSDNDTAEQTENDPEPAVTSSPQQEGSGGFFWKMNNDETGATVFLLGSVHAASPDFYPLHQVIEQSFDDSDVLAVEANIVDIDPLEAQQMLDAKAKLPDGMTLEQKLDAETLAALKEKLKAYGILNFSFFNQYEPWYISMLIESFEIMNQGYDPESGIDVHFLKAAGDKEIVELEGMEFQLDMFAGFSDEIQLMLLESAMDEIADHPEMIDELMTAWKQGDEEGMSKLLMSDYSDEEAYQTYMKKMLDDRNVGMVEKIEQFYAGDQNVFVVVGTAHYLGKAGIIQLLQDKGYEVEKVL